MTTLGPKTGNAATFMADLASEMITNGGWEEGDSYVTNDQSTTDWHNNARCLYHSATDLYMVMHPEDSNSCSGDHRPGMMFNLSTDWDSNNHHPLGQTTVYNEAPYYSAVNNADNAYHQWTNESHNYQNSNGNGPQSPKFNTQTSDANWNDRAQWASTTDTDNHFTYAISVGANYVTVHAHNDHPQIGAAGVMAWEYMDDKFWDDGNEDFNLAVAGEDGSGDYGQYFYGFDWVYSNNWVDNERPWRNVNPISDSVQCKYGFINPDTNDDSFFFTHALLEDSCTSRRRPIGYCHTVIPNRVDKGANHGDTVSQDGRTYRIMKKAGGDRSRPISWGFRWE